MGKPTNLANPQTTRRGVLTGAMSLLLSTALPGSAFPSGAFNSPGSSTVGMATVPVPQKETIVFAVTNRPPTGSTDPSNQFGVGHADVTSCCLKVLVTGDRDQRSTAPSWVYSLRSMSFEEMAVLANRHLPRRNAIVLVHGYNNTYNDAVIAASQLRHDIQTNSSIFTVAWNSQGSRFGYPQDAEETWFTEKLVRNLLIDLLKSPEFTGVQLIAHSMGGRGSVAALGNIARSRDAELLRKVSRVILAAPDVDVDIFNADYVPAATQYGFDTTLYVSSKDLMMRISEFWNIRPRVGGAWATIYLNPRIDTIDVSDVDETTLGHSTIFESSRLANDMHYVLEQRVLAQARYHLEHQSIQGGSYWKMRP
jgi:esterase/lipase superfamily enzyme